MTRRGAAAIKLRQNRMAHASECLAQIAASGLRYVEQPVTIEYSAYSLAKGQGVRDAVFILLDLDHDAGAQDCHRRRAAAENVSRPPYRSPARRA